MTAIIAPRLENADCSRRWLFAGSNGACPKGTLERPADPRTAPFALMIKPASTRARSTNNPDRCFRLCHRAPLALSAIAKST